MSLIGTEKCKPYTSLCHNIAWFKPFMMCLTVSKRQNCVKFGNSTETELKWECWTMIWLQEKQRLQCIIMMKTVTHSNWQLPPAAQSVNEQQEQTPHSPTENSLPRGGQGGSPFPSPSEKKREKKDWNGRIYVLFAPWAGEQSGATDPRASLMPVFSYLCLFLFSSLLFLSSDSYLPFKILTQ